MAKDTLKFQEMWDGFEGLRRGELLCLEGLKRVRPCVTSCCTQFIVYCFGVHR